MKTKKLLIVGIAIIVIIAASVAVFLIVSCNKEDLMHYEVPILDGSPTVSTGNGEMSLDEVSAFLSQLTNENGTGQINLNMTVDEIAIVLDETGIPYEIKGEWEDSIDCRYIIVKDGTSYRPGINSTFNFHRTKKGLSSGDQATKALELYGEPDKIVKDTYYDNIYDYYYNMGKQHCKLTNSQRTVMLNMMVSEETVIYMEIRFLDEDEEGAFF